MQEAIVYLKSTLEQHSNAARILQASTKEPAETSNGKEEPRYRYQFFQTPSKVEVAVLAKNLTAERVTVDIQEQWLGVVILDERGQQVGYSFLQNIVSSSLPAQFPSKLMILICSTNFTTSFEALKQQATRTS